MKSSISALVALVAPSANAVERAAASGIAAHMMPIGNAVHFLQAIPFPPPNSRRAKKRLSAKFADVGYRSGQSARRGLPCFADFRPGAAPLIE
ncbi:hypothetical protein [Mesorhizobium tianshanense]|uniref:hypothetical protein n=1 Tax=Mesorhizobium tianshanense TaxID=39844 RepID=UPI0012DFC5EF|nr:hypothetical protein [Mesorhizobium tianshanense]